MAKIVGREGLDRKLAVLPKQVKTEIAKAVPLAGDDLVAMMKRLAPVDKGMLVASIRMAKIGETRVQVIAGGTPMTIREIRKGSGVFTDEARLIEFGTRPHRLGGKFKGARHPGTPPRPFFFPAYRALKKLIKSRITRAGKKAMKQVAAMK